MQKALTLTNCLNLIFVDFEFAFENFQSPLNDPIQITSSTTFCNLALFSFNFKRVYFAERHQLWPIVWIWSSLILNLLFIVLITPATITRELFCIFDFLLKIELVYCGIHKIYFNLNTWLVHFKPCSACCPWSRLVYAKVHDSNT